MIWLIMSPTWQKIYIEDPWKIAILRYQLRFSPVFRIIHFMKKIFFSLMLLPFMVGAQESVNMTFFSNFDLPNLPTRFGAEYNDCWGYHANGAEIAILGGIEDIFFID